MPTVEAFHVTVNPEEIKLNNFFFPAIMLEDIFFL
jgi:hypothetical protein